MNQFCWVTRAFPFGRSVVKAAFLASFAGCAGMDVERVEPGSNPDGFRYFMPRPYLLVTKEKDKPGDTILLNEIKDTLFISPSEKHRASLTLKPNVNLVSKTLVVSVLPLDAAVFELARSDGSGFDPLPPHKSPSGQVVPGSFRWQVRKDGDTVFMRPTKLSEIAAGETHSLVIRLESTSDPDLVGTLKVSLSPANPITPDGNTVVALGPANKGPQPGGASMSVVYLPDPTREIAVERTEGLGSFDMTLKLKDGWMLTEVGSAGKSEVPETITATATLVEKLPGLLTAVGAFLTFNAETQKYEQRALKAGLYYMDFDKEGKFLGLIAVGQLE